MLAILTLMKYRGQWLKRNGRWASNPDCCCKEPPPTGPCDCNCSSMEDMTILIELQDATFCTFGYDFFDSQLEWCRWRYGLPDPSPCFDWTNTQQVNYITLTCYTTEEADTAKREKWELFVSGDDESGSIGGTLLLDKTPCPPPGTYPVDMYDTSFNYVCTLQITIP
jgi:hypothetical protein